MADSGLIDDGLFYEGLWGEYLIEDSGGGSGYPIAFLQTAVFSQYCGVLPGTSEVLSNYFRPMIGPSQTDINIPGVTAKWTSNGVVLQVKKTVTTVREVS
jgi:hypothetical protein